MSMQFCTIASGSSGNSAFISTGGVKILVDAGLSGRAIEQALASHSIHCSQLDAIFITHEHSDHIQGAGVLSRRYDLPIYMTRGTWDSAHRINSFGKISDKNRFVLTPDVPVALGDTEILPFRVDHDAGEPVGYTIRYQGRKIAIATDLGHTDANLAQHFSGAELILLESNHDLDMLQFGPYPAHLKRRIMSNSGHLSNVACGKFLTDIYTDATKHIFLAHLSQDNNRPILAYETVRNIMSVGQIDVGGAVNLYLADRYRPSAMIAL